MPDIEILSLSIFGHAGRPIPNRFFRQAGGASTLAVIFPGLNYSADMPLLYYSAALLRQRGADVLQVRADYTVGEYAALSPAERFLWLVEDARAAVQVGYVQGQYAQLVLVGKSIGTLALAGLTSTPLGMATLTVWLTPLLKQPQLVDAVTRLHAPAFFACGTHDQTFDVDAFQQIVPSADRTMVLIEKANHSLEIPGEIFASLDALDRVMGALAEFLAKHHA